MLFQVTCVLEQALSCVQPSSLRPWRLHGVNSKLELDNVTSLLLPQAEEPVSMEECAGVEGSTGQGTRMRALPYKGQQAGLGTFWNLPESPAWEGWE